MLETPDQDFSDVKLRVLEPYRSRTDRARKVWSGTWSNHEPGRHGLFLVRVGTPPPLARTGWYASDGILGISDAMLATTVRSPWDESVQTFCSVRTNSHWSLRTNFNLLIHILKPDRTLYKFFTPCHSSETTICFKHKYISSQENVTWYIYNKGEDYLYLFNRTLASLSFLLPFKQYHWTKLFRRVFFFTVRIF